MFVKAVSCFLSQLLKSGTFEKIENHFLQRPEFQRALFSLFCLKFDPERVDHPAYQKLKKELIQNSDELEQLAVHFIDKIVKTNYFLPEKKAVAFRLDPHSIASQFALLPYGIFFVYNPSFFGFHIRFQDIARGGLRTVIAKNEKDVVAIAPTILSECYELALTQQRKNKDIPEGGSKGIIFISQRDQLYDAQKAFIESLISLVNFTSNGTLKEAVCILDYYGQPEYLYLGPDEHMHDSMIEWIAEYSKKIGYIVGAAFISGKPEMGINHKEYGVTSWGVTTCMEVVLRFLGYRPESDPFTVKMSGGPDGDVAGNQIVNFQKYYSKTAQLVLVRDVSGLLFDPDGLNLKSCSKLFFDARPIRFYPTEELSTRAFLLHIEVRKGDEVSLAKNQKGVLEKVWLSEKEAEEQLLWQLNQCRSDIFIPAGGRPATLNIENVKDFIDSQGQPTARAIIEGANLYLTDEARGFLEKKGVVIIKDSSANKGGVICSSFEVLANLVLTEEEFRKEKEVLVQEILERIKKCVNDEVSLILQLHKETKKSCSEISNEISERINSYAAQLLHYLEPIQLPEDPAAPLLTCFFAYVLPRLRDKYPEQLLKNVPESHKKAIIATYIASELVYRHGLEMPHHILPLIPKLLTQMS